MKIDQELWREIAERGDGAIDERIREALSGLQSERELLTQARSQAAEAVAEIDRQLARIERVTKAAEAPAARAKRAAPKRAAEETRKQVMAYLAERPDQALTVREIAEGTELHETTVRNAMAALRADELIRLAGTRASQRNAEEYRVMAGVSGGDSQ